MICPSCHQEQTHETRKAQGALITIERLICGCGCQVEVKHLPNYHSVHNTFSFSLIDKKITPFVHSSKIDPELDRLISETEKLMKKELGSCNTQHNAGLPAKTGQKLTIPDVRV
jgi:transcription elongation factor Elf1